MPTSRSKGPGVAQRILEQATRLFAAHGFAGVSLADISRSVGIRKPSLLYHFQSKDTLRQAVLEQLLAHWNDVLPKLLAAATSGSEQFDAVFAETVAFFVDDPDRARLILRELLDRPEQMQPLIETHVRPWATIVADYIKRGQEQGRLHFDAEPRAYVAHMTILILGSVATFECLTALTPEGDAEVERERHIAELLRIAKTSLFRPLPTARRPAPSADEARLDPSREDSERAAGS